MIANKGTHKICCAKSLRNILEVEPRLVVNENKRQAKLDARSRDNQFKGYRSLATGQSESYLKNGMYF